MERRNLNTEEPQSRPLWYGYVVTVVMQAALTAGLLRLEPYFPLADYPISYVVLIMAVAYWFGEGPAILATVLGLLAYDFYFVSPRYALWPPAINAVGWAKLTAFFLGALMVGYAAVYIRRSQFRTLTLTKELREGEQRLSTLLNTAPTGIVIHAADGRIVSSNRAAQEMLCISSKEMIGKSDTDEAWQFLRQDGTKMPHAEFPVVQVLANRQPLTGLIAGIQRKGGSDDVVWVTVNAIPMLNADGSISEVIISFMDITERKHAEQALRDSEERYRRIVETSQEGIWLIDADMKTTYVNQRMADMLGYSRDEMMGRSPLDFVDDRYLEIARNGLERRKLGHRAQSEICYRRKDRTELWAIISASSVMDDSGRFIGALGMITDITDRKRAEEELRESEARFALAQSAAEIGTWEYDVATGNTKWSDNLFRMFGLTPAPHSPPFEEWLQTIYPDDRQHVRDDVTRSLSEGIPFCTEYRFVWPDGKVHWLMARAHTSYDKNGTPVSLTGIAIDITETVELRQAIERQLMLLQRALAPAAPATYHGYQTAAVYLPAFPGEQIGGDLYDVFPTEDGRIAVMIGDVSGKGTAAASLAAAARSTIRSFAYELSSPSAAISHANTVLQPEATDSEVFVTALLIIIDPATGRLRYANAGHPPAAVWRMDGQVEFMESGGPPIGFITNYQYTDSENHLDPGDKIVLYTDGVLEARTDYEIFDEDGVRRALIECGHGTPDEVASKLLTAARDWAKGSLRDDVAIVVVERPLV